MTPCSATAGDGDADTAGRTKPDCDIPPVPDPDSGDAELPNAANEPMDEERPGPARPTPLLPMSPTAATDAGLALCAGGCGDSDEGPGVGPVLTRGAVLPDLDSASDGSGTERRGCVSPVSTAASGGRSGDSSDRLSVDRSSSPVLNGSPFGGPSGRGVNPWTNCTVRARISSAAPTAIPRARAAALVMMLIAVGLLLGTCTSC